MCCGDAIRSRARPRGWRCRWAWTDPSGRSANTCMRRGGRAGSCAWRWRAGRGKSWRTAVGGRRRGRWMIARVIVCRLCGAATTVRRGLRRGVVIACMFTMRRREAGGSSPRDPTPTSLIFVINGASAWSVCKASNWPHKAMAARSWDICWMIWSEAANGGNASSATRRCICSGSTGRRRDIGRTRWWFFIRLAAWRRARMCGRFTRVRRTKIGRPGWFGCRARGRRSWRWSCGCRKRG